MAQKRTPLSAEEIVTIVDGGVKECVGWYDSKLSKERERVTRYYNSQLPRQQHAGSSSYVSTDVYDSVESMKSQLLETFAGNQDDLISFPPQGADDIEAARIATEYCSYIIFRENNGYQIFSDIIHNGLTARVGVAKAFWETKHEDTDETFEGIPHEDVQGLAAQPDIPELEADQDPLSGLFSGKLKRRKDCSKVTITVLAPEAFGIHKRATSIKDADFCYHKEKKSKAQLIKDGFDKNKVEGIATDENETPWDTEEQARFDPISDVLNNTALQPETEKVWLYEVYARLNLRDGNGTKLYKIMYAGNVLLEEPQEVYCAPFFAFVPLPVPHSFFGNNFAARVIASQNARTVLTRAIIDHASVTTNPRYTVVQGGLLNPKEMLDNRLGGIVNIKRPDAVRPLEQANLNPFVFQTLEMLKTNKEESTGISSLSQGLNKEAISTQNSQGLVADLVTLSQGRQKIIARNFAYNFLIPLYLEVYRLVLENEEKEKIVEIAGNWVPVSAEDWRERALCKASVNLGYGDREKETVKYANTHQLLLSTAGPMYTPQNQFNLLTDGLKSANFKDPARYLTSPDKVQPPPPDPLKVKELEIKEEQAKAATLAAQAAMTKVQNTAALDAVKAQIEELKAQVLAMTNARTADRQDADVANRIDVSQREMALAENPPENTESRGIISPNG